MGGAVGVGVSEGGGGGDEVGFCMGVYGGGVPDVGGGYGGGLDWGAKGGVIGWRWIRFTVGKVGSK